MCVLVIVLVGYGSNDNRLRVWEKMNSKVFHSDHIDLHRRVLPAIHQFFASDKKGNSNCEPCCHCLYFEDEKRN